MFICSAHTTRSAIDQCVRPGEGVAVRSALLVKKNVLDCTARELIPIVCDDLTIDSNIWTGRLRESCRRRVVGAAEPCLVGAWQASRGCARLASRVGAAKSAEVASRASAEGNAGRRQDAKKKFLDSWDMEVSERAGFASLNIIHRCSRIDLPENAANTGNHRPRVAIRADGKVRSRRQLIEHRTNPRKHIAESNEELWLRLGVKTALPDIIDNSHNLPIDVSNRNNRLANRVFARKEPACHCSVDEHSKGIAATIGLSEEASLD